MAEPHEDAFPELEGKSTGPGLSSGTKGVLGLGILIVIGLSVSVWTQRDSLKGLFGSSPARTATTDDQTAGNLDAVNLAERFATAVFNISYTNVTDQVQKISELMDDDLLEYYKSNFLSSSFRQKLMEQKAYVVFQKTDRAQVVTIANGQTIVRVDGVNFFNSDLNGSQIQLPFSFDVTVEKVNGKLLVTNFKQRL